MARAFWFWLSMMSRVVFCTVEADPARIAEALDSGASEYIMKPFDGDIITAKFAEVGLA